CTIPPQPRATLFPYTTLFRSVVTAGRLTDPAQFGQIIVRGRPDGSLVRVNDIGEVRLGARNYDVVGRLDGKPTALFLVFLRPGEIGRHTSELQPPYDLVCRLL